MTRRLLFLLPLLTFGADGGFFACPCSPAAIPRRSVRSMVGRSARRASRLLAFAPGEPPLSDAMLRTGAGAGEFLRELVCALPGRASAVACASGSARALTIIGVAWKNKRE